MGRTTQIVSHLIKSHFSKYKHTPSKNSVAALRICIHKKIRQENLAENDVIRNNEGVTALHSHSVKLNTKNRLVHSRVTSLARTLNWLPNWFRIDDL